MDTGTALLLRADGFPFDALIIVGTSTCWAEAVQGSTDIIITELANLQRRHVSLYRKQKKNGCCKRPEMVIPGIHKDMV